VRPARRLEPGRLDAWRKKRRRSARVSPPARARRGGHHTHGACRREGTAPTVGLQRQPRDPRREEVVHGDVMLELGAHDGKPEEARAV
jgi:hypothetical protein